MRGQSNRWYVPALQRELEQQHQREIERGDTIMRAAFLRALVRWAARHADDDTENTIAIPTGTVSVNQLVQVVVAIQNLSRHRAGRPFTSA